MQYLYIIFKNTLQVLVPIWNFLSLFFGFPYEEQAKKLGDWNARGEDNPTTDRVVYRANKVSKS